MGDDESRREDARIEALQDRGLRNGTLAECQPCGDIRARGEIEFVMELIGEPICERCADKTHDIFDGEDA